MNGPERQRDWRSSTKSTAKTLGTTKRKCSGSSTPLPNSDLSDTDGDP